MHNEIYETLQSAGISSYATMKQLGHINTTFVKQLSELQSGFATTTMESGIKQVKAISGKSNYKDILNLQVDFTNEYISNVIDFSRQATDVLTEARDEMVSLLEKETGNLVVKTEKPKTQRAARKSS